MTRTYPPLPDAAARELVAAAVAAPSLHNTQPWRFAVWPGLDVVELSADPDRKLPVTDPDGRAMTISCGAALLNLRLALTVRFAREPAVRLLPRGAEPDLLARLTLAGSGRAGAAERTLHDQIWRRHTNRMPFADRPIPPGIWRELERAAAHEQATLQVPDRDAADRLLAATAEAERRCTADPARRAELRTWSTSDARRHDGVPMWAFGCRPATPGPALRDFGIARPDPARRERPFERVPQLAVLLTAGDGQVDWLHAGAALQRVLLTATGHGLVASFLHQSLEWPDLRSELRVQLGERRHQRPGAHPQVVLRLGYAPPTGPTPRRDVAEVRLPGVTSPDQPAPPPAPSRSAAWSGT